MIPARSGFHAGDREARLPHYLDGPHPAAQLLLGRTLGDASKTSAPEVLENSSLLLNAGANAEVIQELLGHADMRMTRRVYAHLLNATIANTVKSKLPSFGNERSNVRRLRHQ